MESGSIQTNKRSKFIRINDYCLAEYIYADLSTGGVETEEYNMYYCDNSIRGIHQIFNADTDRSLTNNIMQYTAIPYKNNRFYAYTRNAKTGKILDSNYMDGGEMVYTDFGDMPFFNYASESIKLYNSNDPVSGELHTISVKTDVLRFHFLSGYQITEHAAIIAGVKMRENTGVYNLFSSIYKNADTYSSLISYNPTPVYLSDSKYDRYIDIAIPSIKYINNLYYGIPSDRSVALNISENGFIRDCPMTITVDECDTEYVEKTERYNYCFYDSSNHYEASVSQYNEYDMLNVEISEASDGNYFNFGVKFGEGSAQNFLNRLKNSGEKWVFIHQLIVYEYMRNGTILKSDTCTIYQENEFTKMRKYRPILSNASSDVSFEIDYMIRLVNESTGEQIIRESSYMSTNVNRYGKNTLGISGINGMINYNIYNKISTNEESMTEMFKDPIYNSDERVSLDGTSKVYTQKVEYPVYVDRFSIYLTDDIPMVESFDDNRIIYAQNDLNLIINPIDTTLRFTLYQKSDVGRMSRYDLSTSNSNIYYRILFNIDNSTKLTIDCDTSDQTISAKNGELSFSISESQANQILASSARDFYIVSYNFSTMKNTVMYVGYWLKNTELEEYENNVSRVREKYKLASDLEDFTDEGADDEYVDVIEDSDTSVALSMSVSSENEN